MTSVNYDDTHLNKVFISNNNGYDIYSLSNIAINKSSASNKVDISGHTNTSGKIKQGGYDYVPRGIIALWSGAITTIPSGWALCNGSNGTPDLQNDFIIGADIDYLGQSTTSITSLNTKIGGSKDAILPSHTHTGITSSDGEHSHSTQFTDYQSNNPNITNINGGANQGLLQSGNPVFSAGNHAHTSTTSTDGDLNSGTNLNLPPYFALAYIMKL
jgi:hypothetical protein